MKKDINILIRGIYAGIMIGIGGIAFLAISDKVIGAFIFSIGLLTICMYDMNLYTGKIGYLIGNKSPYIQELITTLIGNFIGAYFVGYIMRLTRFNSYINNALDIVNVKLNDNLISIFILAFFCGILMYLAVSNFKKYKNGIEKIIGIFMGVMTFLLCGFEHCIANVFYISITNMWSFKAILWLCIVILGNTIGALFIRFYDYKIKK